MKRFVLLACLMLTAATCAATTYHVAPKGSDANPGTEAAPFATLQKGADLLKPGDTLLVEPGVYRQSVKIGTLIATKDKPILIKARVPRASFLIGSVTLTNWKRAPNTRNTWVAPLATYASLVYERNTNREYIEQADLYQTDAGAASFMYDATGKRLYVHTSDGAPPSKHLIDACVREVGFNLLSGGPANWQISLRKHIIIDGFVMQGFSRGGIHFMRGDSCEVRNCVADHCGAGIFMHSSIRSAIRDCEASWCYDRNDNEGGGIAFRGRDYDNVIERCIVHDCMKYGIRHYGGGFQGCVIRDCLVYRIGRCAIHTKGSPDTKRKHADKFTPPASNKPMIVERNVAVLKARPFTLLFDCWGARRNTVGARQVKYRTGFPDDRASQLRYGLGDTFKQGFVDPVNLDFRLQSDSRWRKGKVGAFDHKGDVFFVGKGGNDQADGKSVKTAWLDVSKAIIRLKPGHTLYVLPGRYAVSATLRIPDGAVSIRGHGEGPVVFDGGGKLKFGLFGDGNGTLDVRRIRFTRYREAALATSRKARLVLDQCIFDHNEEAAVRQVGAALVTKCVFYGNGDEAFYPNTEGGLSRVYGCIFSKNRSAFYTSKNLLSEFNCFDNPMSNGRIDGLAEWQTKTGLDSESIAADPQFVDPKSGDFRLKATSPARGRGYLWSPVGIEETPYHWFKRPDKPRIADVRVLLTTASTADIAWRVEGGKGTVLVRYGRSRKKLDRQILHDSGVYLRSTQAVTLADLQPAATYYYQVGSAPYRHVLATDARDPKTYVWDATVRTFTTPRNSVPKHRTFHVAKAHGNDANDGLSPKTAFATVHKASLVVEPGDRVIVDAGEYFGLLRPVRSGLLGAPITFEAAKGARVELSGKRLVQPISALLLDKQHITLRGFVFKEHCKMLQDDVGGGAQLMICDSRGIRIEDCLFDGRMYYMAATCVWRSSDIVFRNNAFYIMSNYTGLILRSNPGRVVFDHNTLYTGATTLGIAMRCADLVFTNNVFGEKIRVKWGQPKFSLYENGAVTFDHNYYAYTDANPIRFSHRIRLKRKAPYIVSSAMDPVKKKGPKSHPLAAARKIGLEKHGVAGPLPWAHADRVTAKSKHIRGVPYRDQKRGPLTLDDFKLKPAGPWKGMADDGGDPGRRSTE